MSRSNPTHPGESIRYCIEEAGLTVTAAAERIGVSRSTLSSLINARQGISPLMAVLLERAGWSTAEFWMRRQAAHDLAAARRQTVAA